MENIAQILKRRFFKSVPEPKAEGVQHDFDLHLDPDLYKNDPNQAYNSALLERMENLDFPDRADFLTHQFSQSEDPRGWLHSLVGLLNALSHDELFGMHDSLDHYLSIVRHLDQQLQNEPANLAGLQGDKLTWRANPGLFFILFSTLHHEGAFNVDQHGLDQSKVADLLHQTFEVRSTRKSKAPYSSATFKQNFKRSSNLQHSQDYIELNDAVEEFIAKLKAIKMLR